MRRILLISIILFSKSVFGQLDFKEFYYPHNECEKSSVYVYRDKFDSDNIEYWKVSIEQNCLGITTTSYTSDFLCYNIFEERLTNQGAELMGYYDYYHDDNGNLIESPESDIISDKVYKWHDSLSYDYSVKLQSSKYGRMLISKKRVFNAYEKIKLNGVNYETIKFQDNYTDYYVDKNREYKYLQYSWYAKGVGMIRYRRFASNKVIELELVKIISGREFSNLREKANRH